MKTKEFLELLKDHQNKPLLFEYRPGALVGANYHITEVKNIRVESVDCGAGTDFWEETVIQLWESPKEIGKTDYMSSYKAMGILNKVHRMRPMSLEAELKFEYSNASFHTAQMFVSNIFTSDKQILVQLSVEKTDCKAKETCGVEAAPSSKKAEACCEPGGGCC